MRQAAVLVPYIRHRGEDSILLIRRPETMSSYAGQVAFPGGSREPDDDSLEQTALRETEEEVGIPPESVQVLRELGWHETTLSHRVKPFVGRVAEGCRLQPDPREVERLLFLPTRRLTPDLFGLRGLWEDPRGQEHEIYTFELDGCEVWGLTARILRELV